MTAKSATRDATLEMHQRWMKADADAAKLARAIATLGTFVDGYELTFEADALESEFVCPSNTVAGGVTVPLEYQTDHERVTIAVEHETFRRAVRFPDDPETVSLRVNDGEDRIQTMASHYLDEAQLVDAESVATHDQPDELEYATTVTTDAQQFKAAVGAVGGPSDEPLRLAAREGTLEVAGRERGTGFVDEWPIQAAVDGPGSTQTYSQSFLGDIATALPPTGEVTIHFGVDHPVRLETEHMWFVLAPRFSGGDA